MRRRWLWVIGGLAVVLALALIGGLLASGRLETGLEAYVPPQPDAERGKTWYQPPCR